MHLDLQPNSLSHCFWLAWNKVLVILTQYIWLSYDSFIFLFLWNILTVEIQQACQVVLQNSRIMNQSSYILFCDSIKKLQNYAWLLCLYVYPKCTVCTHRYRYLIAHCVCWAIHTCTYLYYLLFCQNSYLLQCRILKTCNVSFAVVWNSHLLSLLS